MKLGELEKSSSLYANDSAIWRWQKLFAILAVTKARGRETGEGGDKGGAPSDSVCPAVTQWACFVQVFAIHILYKCGRCIDVELKGDKPSAMKGDYAT